MKLATRINAVKELSDKHREVLKQMEESKRDLLFNAVLETVKENGKGMEIGLVRAVLAEVESEIVRCTGRQEFVAICDKLKRREPRECNQHSQGTN